MQNSQPNRKLTPKAPRRARRGALMPAALLAVLVITILMSQFAQAQLRQASAARSEARAVQLAAIAADFDYYVFEKRGYLATGLTEASKAGQELAPDNKGVFETDFLRVVVAHQLPGFTLRYLVGHINDGTDVYGGLLLSISDTNGASQVEMETLIARLATYGAQDRVLDHARFVQNVLGRTLTGSERVILTAPLSGLDPKYVLRMRRAGHAAPKLVGSGALDLNGHNLTVRTLTAIGGDASSVRRVVITPPPGEDVRLHTREMTGTLTSVGSAPGRGGDIEIDGTTRVSGSFIVQRSLTAGGLSIPSDSARVVDVRLSGPMNTSTLATATLTTDNLTSTAVAVTRAAHVNERLTTDVLRSDGLTTTEMIAGQVFTERATVEDRLKTKGCTGC